MDNTRIPGFISQYFWGDDLSQLHLEKNKKYIIETILEKGDKDAIHWLFSKFDKKTVAEFLPELKLSKKSANFWEVYLHNI